MTKRLQPILVVAMVLLASTLCYADKFEIGKVSNQNGNMVVPVVVSTTHQLAGLDVPLRWSEGVTLKSVEFSGTDVEYFDFKSAYIQHENRTVLIGLIAQLGPDTRPELKAGENEICRLVFEVNDPSVTKFTIDAIETKNPNHSLTYIYHDENGTVRGVRPDFSSITVSATYAPGDVPTSYALRQNFPNPFNPSTKVALDLPKAGKVTMRVYNILGQCAMEPFADRFMEAGSHMIELDCSHLSSGVYFYKVTAGDFTATKKMTLLK